MSTAKSALHGTLHNRDALQQVEGARKGLTHTLGGNTATVLVSLFGRD